MNNITLVSVSWKQPEAIKLMLKSYLAEHYKGEPLKCIIFDNESTPESRDWFFANHINLHWSHSNIGHENAVNNLWQLIDTKYALLVDSDIRFTGNIEPYLEYLKDDYVAIGEVIGELNAAWGQIKPRLGPWMILFDIEKCKDSGINIFRDPEITDWSFDVGSYFFKEIIDKGFKYHDIKRMTEQFAPIAVYEKFIHYGGVSWCLDRPDHSNRIIEIIEKRSLIKKTLEEYSYIDIKNKFI